MAAPDQDGPTAAQLADRVVDVLDRYSFTGGAETRLHDGVEAALTAAGIGARREYRLPGDAAGRLDLLADGGVAVEVKVAGRPADVLRQLQRYARHDDVAALVLVTNRAAHSVMPLMVGGKPCRVVWIRGIG